MTTKNISLLGATYSNVPGVTLPVSGGGSATFYEISDTTASASDVASGKYFYTSAGVKTEGTNSGGGGASNIVSGSFTTGASNGVESFNVSYTGGGYPIIIVLEVDGLMSNTTWAGVIRQSTIGYFAVCKRYPNSHPDVDKDSINTCFYKSSSSSASGVNYSVNISTKVYEYTTNPSSSTSYHNAVRIALNDGIFNVIKFYVTPSSRYGLTPNTKYNYYIVYSS